VLIHKRDLHTLKKDIYSILKRHIYMQKWPIFTHNPTCLCMIFRRKGC